jgi:hypothetical protein
VPIILVTRKRKHRQRICCHRAAATCFYPKRPST